MEALMEEEQEEEAGVVRKEMYYKMFAFAAFPSMEGPFSAKQMSAWIFRHTRSRCFPSSQHGSLFPFHRQPKSLRLPSGFPALGIPLTLRGCSCDETFHDYAHCGIHHGFFPTFSVHARERKKHAYQLQRSITDNPQQAHPCWGHETCLYRVKSSFPLPWREAELAFLPTSPVTPFSWTTVAITVTY